MGAGQSNNIEAMLGSVGDIYDDTPSRADAFVDVDGLAPAACARLVSATEPLPVRDDKRLDERLQRAIALAATLELSATLAAEAEGAEGAEAEGAEGAETEAETEGAEGAEGAEAETEGAEAEDEDSEDDETDSAGCSDTDDEPDGGAGYTIATCARAMGHEPRRLYPATAETLARAVCSGHAIVAVRNDAEEAQVAVFCGCVVEDGVATSFEAEVFGSGGESSTERVDPHDLRFMYGFWHVRPLADRGPRDDEAGEE